MTCHRCGSPLQAGTRVCGRCGAPTDQHDQPGQPQGGQGYQQPQGGQGYQQPQGGQGYQQPYGPQGGQGYQQPYGPQHDPGHRPPYKSPKKKGSAVNVAIGLVAVLVIGAILSGGVYLVAETSRDGSAPEATKAEDTASPFSDFSSVYDQVSSGVGQLHVERCEGNATGSAFLVEQNTVLTAFHVVEDATGLTVELNGSRLEAKVVTTDEEHDLAVLELSEPVEDAHVFSLASDVPTTGTRIAAIGFPFGSPKTLTEGTVSGSDREITVDGNTYSGLLQTDTAINPGNSGGPLVNIRGEVVGVADAGRLDAQGIGYAVPSTTAAESLEAPDEEVPPETCY